MSIVGESVNFYTNRVRLEKSARFLKYSTELSLSDIAYACGFSSPSTFSRSFKDYYGISPSKYRKGEPIDKSKICKEFFPFDEYLAPMTLEEKRQKFPVKIKSFPKRKVAYIRVTNSYEEGVVEEAFNNLIEWTKSHSVHEQGYYFGMSMDDPMTTPKESYRYEACFVLPKSFQLHDSLGIDVMEMPALKYATTKVSGDIIIVATATQYLFSNWLLSSRYEPEHHHGLEIFLDKENVTNWSHFDLELCIPIQKINKTK